MSISCLRLFVRIFIAVLLSFSAMNVWAQSAEVRSLGVYYIDDTNTSSTYTPNINDVYCNWEDIGSNPANYKGGIVNIAGKNTSDPWQTSALIEYDQPYPSPTKANKYPNHCLGVCMDIYCTNKPNGAATYSVSFPIQNVRFEMVKYYGSKDIANPDTNPAVRTIDMSLENNYIVNGSTAQNGNIDLSNFMCAAYSCWGSSATFNNTQTCPNPLYECVARDSIEDEDDKCTTLEELGESLSSIIRPFIGEDKGYCCKELTSTSTKYDLTPTTQTLGATALGDSVIYCGDYTSCSDTDTSGCANGRESQCIIRAAGTGKGYNDPIKFCTSWDGSYEILGEFGKTNGQFGVRGTIHTDYPGDGIAVENITIDQTFTYPGNNQYPIQVDVTNVHTVRSTPSVVGSITSVAALPYTMTYRLSKDADVKMQIFDASAVVPFTDQGTTSMTNSAAKLVLTSQSAVRNLVDWQPRLGEGFKGSDSDKLLVESDSWDGRDDNGRLLPANNYIVSIQAKSQDEFPGTDFSRAVTRQISVDPLKLTDIQVAGLNKQSTAYAMVRYVPTEASTVYFEVYSPGTTFASLDTDGSTATGTKPTVSEIETNIPAGVLVYHSEQQRGRAASYPDKWDGLCHNTSGCAIPYPAGAKNPLTGEVISSTNCANSGGTWNGTASVCTITYANGAPLPDGDYVYVLWAEVPYTDTYEDAAGRTYTGVKTLKYYTGILPVERGVVDITIQPVSYSTIGSSPTAYGLDPFIFKYSIAREATVNAYVKNSAGVVVKTLTDEGGNTNVAQQMNTLTWDGRDDLGRMVGPGTYLFVVETSDPMFPSSVKTQASTLFPVDMYRVVDVSATDVYGDSDARATINYYLSKAMNVQVNVYNKDVVIPVLQDIGSPVYAWPPRVCNTSDDNALFTNGYVDPAKNPYCIYVNDTGFKNYPTSRQAAEYKYAEGATQTLDVRLQPIKTFNRSALKAGDGVRITEEWDAQYFYNPTPVSVANGGKNSAEAVAACTNSTDITQCPYEMVPDGTYPFYISARTEEPVSLYYAEETAEPTREAITPQNGLYATDKVVHRVNVTRGPVYFLDGTVAVYPNAPQLFNTSSGPVFVPPYEINFAISRAATVEVAVVALQDNLCTVNTTPVEAGDANVANNKAGDVCKYLSTMTIVNTPNFDPNVIRKLYWDGTDNNGKYVRNGNYEIRLTAKNYPDAGLYQPTVKQLTVNVDLLKVYDLPETEAYAISQRGTDMKISYQISVPMKVAIQIFKPGTTIYDYQKGTLRDPATGKEVTEIRDVLVKTIVGIRPSTTLIEELWDGTDYAQQDVPDGTYPFRFVTALNSADIDTITGEIVGEYEQTDGQNTDTAKWKINKVADTYQYVNLHHATVAIGDGMFVCEDWEKTVFFYPNPFKTPTGTLEVTKLPVPGKMSIKMYNLAGDLVREGGYTCVDANNYSVTMGSSLEVEPDNRLKGGQLYDSEKGMDNVRNAALRCFWDRTNDHGKKVARGVYFGLVDFRAKNGRQHCQKVVKILIPR